MIARMRVRVSERERMFVCWRKGEGACKCIFVCAHECEFVCVCVCVCVCVNSYMLRHDEYVYGVCVFIEHLHCIFIKFVD